MSKRTSASPVVKKVSINQFFAKILHAILIVSFLAGSAPAAPQTVIGIVGQVSQDVRFAFLSGRLSIDFPGWFVGAFLTTRTMNQDEKIERIRIFPGSITLKQGHQAVFAAVAYDEDNAPLSGVDFNWKTRNEGRGRDVRLMNNSVFEARISGTFTVTAKARGKEAQVTVTVTPFQYAPAQTREKESDKADVSSRGGKSSGKEIGRDKEVKSEKNESEEDTTIENQSPLLVGDVGWNEQNQPSADDPINIVGRPPGRKFDYGAGSSNFMLTAPALSLPGRGLDLSLGLTYNSRLWNKSNYELTYDIDRGFPAPGWSLGFGKMLDIGTSGRSMMVEPDGTRHSFDGTLRSPFFDGYTTDGTFINYTSYRHTDGSITFAEAWLPNGTYIKYTARGEGAVYPTLIRDRQGNFITITYRNNQGPAIETVTDTTGRLITFNYDTSNRLISITAPRTAARGEAKTRTLVRLHYKNQSLNHSFASPYTAAVRNNATVVNVIDAIYYPATNTGYWFGDADSYSTYGMIAKVVEQRGMSWATSAEEQGTVSAGTMTRKSAYNYPLSTADETGRAPGMNLIDAPAYTKLTNTWDNGSGGTQSAETTFQVNQDFSPRSTVITQPHPTLANTSLVTKQYSFNNLTQYNGMIDKIETFTKDPSGALTFAGRTKMTWEETLESNISNYRSPRPLTIETTDERNQTTKTEYGYGTSHNQVTSLKEFGYDGFTLLRETRTQYVSSPGYDRQHIFNLVDYTEVLDGSGTTRLSYVDYNYDENPLAETSGVIQHDEAYNPYAVETCGQEPDQNDPDYMNPNCSIPGTLEYNSLCDGIVPDVPFCRSPYDFWTNYRGNVTTVKAYAEAQNLTAPVTETRSYDKTGNVISASSSCCEQTSIQYTINTQFAYPESVTRGAADANSPHRMTTSAVYNRNTGLVTQTTDANGRPTNTQYNWDTLRPTVSTASTGAQVSYTYNDAAMTVTEEMREVAGGAIAGSNTRRLNGLGLVWREESLGANGVSDVVDTQYTKLGQVWKQSRPYRAGETQAWSEISFDAMGRTNQIAAQDGSATQTFYNEQARPDSASTAAGQTLRSRDAWGRERWVRYDALGRLAETVEPNPNGDGSVFSAGTLMTKQTYDAVDNLTKTEQGEQAREFAYDSLGRLTRQKLAEQSATLNDAGQYVGAGAGRWSEAFWYDNRSNPTIRRDARGVTVWSSYQINGADDPLNRLQSVYYDLSGPRDTSQTVHDARTVSYEYEPAGDKTRIKKISTAQVNTEDFLYDTEGRLYEQKQTIADRPSYPQTTNYLYDTLSRVKDVHYPAQYGLTNSPRKVVQYSYDTASRLSTLMYDGQQQAGEIVYNAASQATQLKIGAAGANQVTENYGFDNQTGLLSNQSVQRGGSTLLDLSYDYRKNLDGTNNGKTGQLRKITNNLDANRNREYAYDALGRLTSAKGGNNLWQQVYSYDRYGNKLSTTAWGVAANGTPIPRDGHASVSYNITSNRINGFEYDAAGNQTRALAPDGQSWLRYEYDGANRLMYVKNDAGTTVLQSFTYGATNARLISRDGQNNLTYYAWAGAEVIAEYSELASQPGVVKWAKSYVSAGGRLVSTASLNGTSEKIEHHHADRLGTRVVSDPTGGYFEQETLPFGTALNAESSAATNRRFTSYDRSNITGLDYAVNRTYDSGQSRFTQVDPIGMAATNLGNPQSLNLYAYVENDPSNFTDPSGLLMIPWSGLSNSWWSGVDWSALFGVWTVNVYASADPWDYFDASNGGDDGFGSGRRGGPSIDDHGIGVAEGKEPKDCQKFADIIGEIANKAANAKDFLQAVVDRFIGGNLNVSSRQDFDRAANVGGSEFGASGFKSQFIDDSNQVRHFTGGLWAGYIYGPGISTAGMNSNENNSLGTGRGATRSGLGVLPWIFPADDAKADVALNSISTGLGANLTPRAEEFRDIGVRGGWRKTPANPGYKGLAEAIRKRVCE